MGRGRKGHSEGVAPTVGITDMLDVQRDDPCRHVASIVNEGGGVRPEVEVGLGAMVIA